MPHFSIVMLAHDDVPTFARAMAAVRRAIARVGVEAEVVVADAGSNRSASRNAGVASSRGDTVVIIDADAVMHADALVEVRRLVRHGGFVGGGCRPVADRKSPGVRVPLAVVAAELAITGLGAVMFWCARADFDAIGGFDESLTAAEDLDFARRLRQHGRQTGRQFRNVRDAPVTVCRRKFDLVNELHALRLVGATY